MHNRSVIVTFFSLILFLPSCFDFHVSNETATYTEQEVVEKEHAFDARGSVTISNSSGQIDVTVWDKNNIHVEATKKGATLNDVENIVADIRVSDNEAIIKTVYKKRFVNAIIDYKVIVPHQATIKQAKTGSGSISIKGVEGSIETYSGSGRIEIEGARESIKAETGSGTIIIEYEENAQGKVQAKTGSGRIEIQDAPGAITAETGSGAISIELAQDANGVIQAKTGSGRIEVFGSTRSVAAETGSGAISIKQKALPANDHIELTTGSGRILLYLVEPIQAEVKVKTARGRFVSAFDIKGAINLPNEVEGVIGNGSATITLQSNTGNIELRKY